MPPAAATAVAAATAAARGVSAAEIEKFRILQRQWWNPNGPLRSLHLFNPVRVQYISHALRRYGCPMGAGASKAAAQAHPSAHSDAAFLSPSLSVLDVGCGGGILSESLARLGASVTGIDMCEESIAVAEQHRKDALNSRHNHWAGRLAYKTASLFDVVAEAEEAKPLKSAYDLVVASEVIEHVSDARGFLAALCKATKPGGLLVLSTMDKTVQTYVSHILLAEQLTGIVAPGTHDWVKFIPPRDVTKYCARPSNDVRNVDIQYVVTYPSVFQSAAARSFEVGFSLSRRINTGHYFWTGIKAPQPTAHAPEEAGKKSE